jgi:threonylcarbamoyladenosine tRNA methylthiotransferase MtaB
VKCRFGAAAAEGDGVLRVCFYSFGCKANQADSGSMAELLRLKEHEIVPEGQECDAVVVNTCAVTAAAERKSRTAIRALRAAHPDAILAVCGCLPEAAGLQTFPGVDLMGDAKDRRGLIEELESLAAQGSQNGAPCNPVMRSSTFKTQNLEFLPAAMSDGRTRAYIKIQDGCNNHCAYCVIPRTRGPARSLPAPEVLEQARRLRGKGYPELVLTGIEIASYPDLAGLVRALSRELPDTRLRLGSLEPRVLTGDVIARLAEAETLCPHFHVSLQSGCDRTLRRMGRRYTAAGYLDTLARLRERFPGAAITTDLICGFPGETDEDWAETLALIRRAGFSQMHIFPYSRRPGTTAASLPDQITRAVKKARAAEAAEAARAMARAYREAQIGRVLSVLFETEENGRCAGHSENYLPVAVDAPGLRGQVRAVRITGAGDTLSGVWEAGPASGSDAANL